MVNSTLTAITKQLGTTFGNSYRYYLENVEQGLKKPCFVVDTLIPIQRSKSPVLYDRTIPIVIHYFSDSIKDTKKDCYKIAERVIECLEYLPFKGSFLRGENISWHIVEDVLEIFITYKFTTRVIRNVEETIETLESNITHN